MLGCSFVSWQHSRFFMLLWDGDGGDTCKCCCPRSPRTVRHSYLELFPLELLGVHIPVWMTWKSICVGSQLVIRYGVLLQWYWARFFPVRMPVSGKIISARGWGNTEGVNSKNTCTPLSDDLGGLCWCDGIRTGWNAAGLLELSTVLHGMLAAPAKMFLKVNLALSIKFRSCCW